MQGFVRVVALLLIELHRLVQAREALRSLHYVAAAWRSVSDDAASPLQSPDFFVLTRGPIVEGRVVSDLDGVVRLLAVNFMEHTVVDLVYEEVVLNPAHTNPEFNQLSHEQRQGSQGVLDQVQDRDHCEGDVQLKSVAEANVEREDHGLQDLGEEIEVGDQGLAYAHSAPESPQLVATPLGDYTFEDVCPGIQLEHLDVGQRLYDRLHARVLETHVVSLDASLAPTQGKVRPKGD